jgi:hypothetical protein
VAAKAPCRHRFPDRGTGERHQRFYVPSAMAGTETMLKHLLSGIAAVALMSGVASAQIYPPAPPPPPPVPAAPPPAAIIPPPPAAVLPPSPVSGSSKTTTTTEKVRRRERERSDEKRDLPGRGRGEHGNSHQDRNRPVGHHDDALDHHHDPAVAAAQSRSEKRPGRSGSKRNSRAGGRHQICIISPGVLSRRADRRAPRIPWGRRRRC